MNTNYLILIFICGNMCNSVHTEATTNISHVLSSTIQISAAVKNAEETSFVTVSLQTTAFSRNIDANPQLTPSCQAQNNKTESKDVEESWIAALSIGGILVLMLVAIIIIVIWRCVNKPVSVDPNWAGRSPFADGENPAELAMQAKKRTSLAYIGSLPFLFHKSQHLLDDCGIQENESRENMNRMQSYNMENGILKSNLRTEAENTTKTMNNIHVPPCLPAVIRPDDHSHLTKPLNSLPPPSELFDLSSTQSPSSNSFDISNLQAPPTDSFDLSITSSPDLVDPPPLFPLPPSSVDLQDISNLFDQ